MFSFLTGLIVSLVFGWQVQGGQRQYIQLTTSAHDMEPALIVDSFQGNQEDSDNLQPVSGYNVLNTGHGIPLKN